MKRHAVYKMILYSIMGSLFFSGFMYAQTGSDITAQIGSSKSEYEKKELLRKLIGREVKKGSQISAALEAPVKASDPEIENAITMCLNDASPIVVEEAIKGISYKKLQTYESTLITLYSDASGRFGGYAERVRLAILSALGAIGSTQTSQLFSEILMQDNGSVTGSHTLNAIKELKDLSLISDLEQYAAKLDEIVNDQQAAGLDPMIYSTKQKNAQLAREIVAILSGKKGE